MLDLLVAASTAVGAVTLLFGAVWYFVLPRLREQITGKLDRIEGQVTNSHKTNLRDDVDQLTREVIGLKWGQETSLTYQQETRSQLNTHLAEARHDSEKLDRMQNQIGRIEGLLEGYFQSQRGNRE